ncbi:MAG: L-histidine N(alpha)-methyltransferase [Patescibacteria group bacterium]
MLYKDKYDQEWFREKALKSLRKIKEGVWDYSEPILLYSPKGQEAYEFAQKTDSPYFELVTKQEHSHLKSIAKEVVNLLPEKFEYIDLGPGTENKASYFFQELKNQNKSFTYIPVDVSDYFLDFAKKVAEKENVEIKPIKSSFEKLPEIIGNSNIARFISLLGLTFSNYSSSKILKILTNIAGKDGYILIDSQLRERVDILKLQNVYQEYVAPACDEKIKLLDLDPSYDVSPRFADSEISIWSSFIKINNKLKNIGIKKGDEVKLFQSLRPTKEIFEKDLDGLDFKLFDIGNSFISCVIKI